MCFHSKSLCILVLTIEVEGWSSCWSLTSSVYAYYGNLCAPNSVILQSSAKFTGIASSSIFNFCLPPITSLCHHQPPPTPWQRSRSTRISSRSDWHTLRQHGKPTNEVMTRCSTAHPPFWSWWAKPKNPPHFKRIMPFMCIYPEIKMWQIRKLTFATVLAAWLRVPCDPLPLHPWWHVHRHNCKERCDIRRKASKAVRIYWPYVAKHLDQLKGGKIPLHVLVRGKDAEANTKLFEEITGHIKAAGVSHPKQRCGNSSLIMRRRKLEFCPRILRVAHSSTSGRRHIPRFLEMWKKSILHLRFLPPH